MKKDIQKYQVLAEIISAVAVVVSLIFVGLEVRESAKQTALNTQSLQVSTYQDLIAQINDLNKLTLQNPDVAKLETSLSRSYEALSGVERRQYGAFLWEASKGNFVQGYQDYIDQMIAVQSGG